MAKITLSDPAILEDSILATITANNTLIEAAIENTLSRDGTSPNMMESDLDMNDNAILNLPLATDNTSPVRLDQVEELIPDIFSQASAPATSGPDNSLWIDSDSTLGDLFILTAGVWVDTGVNMRAVDGAAGAAGATGATGAAGTNGEVTHTGSVANNDIAVFSGTTGTIIKSSGVSISAIGLTVGTSTITGGTTTRILYDNAGVLGEYTLSGSGTVVAMATSPSFTTPALGAATGTTLGLTSTLTITPGTEVSPLVLTGGTLAGTTSRPLISGTQTWNNSGLTATAFLLNITDTSSNAASLLMDLQVGGTSKAKIFKNGNLQLAGNTTSWLIDTNDTASQLEFAANGVAYYAAINSGGFKSAAGYQFAASISATVDLTLLRDAANTLAQRNGTTAQSFRVYNTWTDASNGEWLEFGFSTNVPYIRSTKNGSGTQRALSLGGSGADNWQISTSGHFLAVTDNTYDIGASGATRPRRIYLSAGVTTAGGAVFLTTSTALTDGAAAGVGTLTNAPASTNPTKWIGINDNGTTRYIPAW